MHELFLTVCVFSLLLTGLIAYFARAAFRAAMRRINTESLTPQDIAALHDAADDLVRRIDEAADAAIARLDAKEREVRELLETRDALILSAEVRRSEFSVKA